MIRPPISATRESYKAKLANKANSPKTSTNQAEINEYIISNIVDTPKSTKDIDMLDLVDKLDENLYTSIES